MAWTGISFLNPRFVQWILVFISLPMEVQDIMHLTFPLRLLHHPVLSSNSFKGERKKKQKNPFALLNFKHKRPLELKYIAWTPESLSSWSCSWILVFILYSNQKSKASGFSSNMLYSSAIYNSGLFMN